MKKLRVLMAGLFFLLLSAGARAQSKTGAEYFAGKWSVLVKATPNGDSKMILVLDKKDSVITGAVQDSTGRELSKITDVAVTPTSLSFGFTAQGYDVTVVINKKDDDHVTGSLMSMFDMDGDRIK